MNRLLMFLCFACLIGFCGMAAADTLRTVEVFTSYEIVAAQDIPVIAVVRRSVGVVGKVAVAPIKIVGNVIERKPIRSVLAGVRERQPVRAIIAVPVRLVCPCRW